MSAPIDRAVPPRSDDLVMAIAGRWHIHRNRALLTWAEDNERTRFSTKAGDSRVPEVDIAGMKRCQDFLADTVPTTIESAVEMLRIVLEILAQREIEPDQTVANGPVMQIVRCAWKGLTRLAPDPVGSDTV